MLTRNRIVKVIESVLSNEGRAIVSALKDREDAAGPGNLVAVMEIFAERLEAEKQPSTVDVIDSRLGPGWCRRLAEALTTPR